MQKQLIDKLNKKHLLNHIEKIINEHKLYLSSTLRYERYMVNETPEQWIDLLGPDVCLLTHANTTEEITKKFIIYNAKNGLQITSDEKEKMLIAPLIHDWGEIIIDGEGIGDITFEKKNAQHETVEISIFKKVISSVKEKLVADQLLSIYLDVVMKENQKLGMMFNAIERLGYMQTAIIAYNGKNGGYIKNWKGLVGNVLSYQIITLLEYSKDYPYVSYFLTKNKNKITNMLEATLNIDVPFDKLGSPTFDKKKLKDTYQSWYPTAINL
jgi:hypothetical protein